MPITRKTRIKIKRVIALFMLFTILNQIFAPNVAFALTAGPTAPEATSFEPIDTTDMVNPLTGDFTYNLPLLEVPGPEGSYPLSLSYHAGIQPNEEASWVGLGWTLNPGSIARNVNGYADDYSDVQQSRRDYWSGGSRSAFGISVTLPIGVSFGLSFAQDTYNGFGVGGSVGYGYSIPNTVFGVGGNFGVEPFGGAYAGAYSGVALAGNSGESGMRLGGSIGFSTNFKSINGDSGVDLTYSDVDKTNPTKPIATNSSMLGASISTSGLKPSLSIGGGSANVYNANAGKIQTRSAGFGIGFPIYGVIIGLSYKYTRYWSDEKALTYTNGSLYFPQQQTDQKYFDGRTYDVSRLQDPKNYDIVDYPNPDRLQGGSFPDFDNYRVTAQGLGGSIRPYIFQSALYTQNQPNDMVQTSGAPITGMNFTPGVQFRFINDFSNSYTQAPDNISGLTFQFDNPKYGNNDGNAGYNTGTNQLAGSKHISWYTNDQINSQAAKNNGFIDTKSAGFTRMGNVGALSNTKGGAQIGGFVITNESGVSYHYALPVYERNEYTYTGAIGGSSYTTETRNEPYAYTWYLTAITGPDFVDKNGDGLADDGDWGFWVTFDYGKWTDQYGWRNPSEGSHIELDPNYESYSQGVKELYYLDAIKTRTHTAIFEKEMRPDAKSNVTAPVGTLVNPAGVYTPKQFNFCYVPDPVNDLTGTGYKYPVSTLRLNNIYLFTNDQLPTDINTMRQRSNNYNQSFTFNGDQSAGNCSDPTYSQVVHQGQYVIDKYDIDATWASKCLRKIAFNYDYSLSAGLPNSYDPQGTNTYTTTPSQPTALLGKLTLLSVDFQGKGATPSTPPIKFQYDLDPLDAENQDNIDITSVPSNLQGNIRTYTVNKFKPGDIISFAVNGATYYCTLLSTSDNTNFKVLYLNAAPGSTPSTIAAVLTKNPPYNKDAYDIWGMYKSDYVKILNNENLSRITTQISNRNTDVWCLRKIQTSVGANFIVKYEGDTYRNSVLNKNKSMIWDGGIVDSVANKITFNIVNPENIPLSSIYKQGQKTDAVMLFKRTLAGPNITTYDKKSMALTSYAPSYITSISSNTLTISVDPNFFKDLNHGTSYSWPTHLGPTSVSGTLLTGNIKSSLFDINYGGGVRVRDLVVDDQSGSVKKTSYNYNMLDLSSNSKVSSGVTSYEPVVLDSDNIYSYLNSTFSTDTAAIKAYHRFLYKDISTLLTLSREAPAPGIMYEYVSVADSSILSNGTTVPIDGQITYQYRVFNTGMIGIHQYQYDKSTTQYSKNLSLKDYTSQIGNVVRTITYDVNGNKLTEKINHYLNDDIVDKSFDYQVSSYDSRLSAFGNQGFIQERYADGRSFSLGNDNWRYELTMSGRDEIPIVQTGETDIDYKNGITINKQDLAFDFYNGQINKTLITDSYGNRFITQTTPAYRKYPAMGLKTTSITNANMLAQEASNYTYAVDGSNNNIGVVSATVQTWSNNVPVLDPDGNVTTFEQTNANIWRMEKSYAWLTSGSSANNITPFTSFVDYYATGGSSDASWKQTSQITKYNVYSAALEATDINTNYAATRMGYNNSKVLLTGGPAQYNEIAYAGAEDVLLGTGNFSNNISPGSGTVVMDSTKSHTGTKSLMVAAGQNGFTYTLASAAGKNYSVAVWVKPTASNAGQASLYYRVNNGVIVTPTQTLAKTAAGWYLLEMTVPSTALTGGSLIVGCNNGSSGALYFDDFRFQPTSAATTAYVYDNQTGELTYILGNNNLYVRYQYDAIGRLVRTYREVLGKSNIPLAKSIAYNYGRYGSANWQSTGTTRCQQANGSNDGYLDIQQKDINSLSPTYNQLKWVTTTTTSSGCPVTIYARLDVVTSSSNTSGNVYNYGNYTIRLFSDADGIVPYTLTSSLTVNYAVQQYITDANSNSYYQTLNEDKIGSTGQNALNVGGIITQRLNTNNLNPFTSGGSSGGVIPSGSVAPYGYYTTVSLSPGSGYTITTTGGAL